MRSGAHQELHSRRQELKQNKSKKTIVENMTKRGRRIREEEHMSNARTGIVRVIIALCKHVVVVVDTCTVHTQPRQISERIHGFVKRKATLNGNIITLTHPCHSACCAAPQSPANTDYSETLNWRSPGLETSSSRRSCMRGRHDRHFR